MEKLFVSYKIAKKLKELKFNEPCFMYWDYDKQMQYKHILNEYPVKNDMFLDLVCAPLYQQVLDWFREKHKQMINISPIQVSASETTGHRYTWDIYNLNDYNKMESDESLLGHLKYYEALDAAILEAIKLIDK